jgi:hypothetical protein
VVMAVVRFGLDKTHVIILIFCAFYRLIKEWESTMQGVITLICLIAILTAVVMSIISAIRKRGWGCLSSVIIGIGGIYLFLYEFSVVSQSQDYHVHLGNGTGSQQRTF